MINIMMFYRETQCKYLKLVRSEDDTLLHTEHKCNVQMHTKHDGWHNKEAI